MKLYKMAAVIISFKTYPAMDSAKWVAMKPCWADEMAFGPISWIHDVPDRGAVCSRAAMIRS